MATKKEQVAFELENPGGFVTQGSEIGWNGQPLTTRINAGSDAKSTTGNANATSIEGKVNALIDCILNLIDGVAFHSGTPFVAPQELKSQLELLRYTYSGTNPAICGSAVCGQTICGVI